MVLLPSVNQVGDTPGEDLLYHGTKSLELSSQRDLSVAIFHQWIKTIFVSFGFFFFFFGISSVILCMHFSSVLAVLMMWGMGDYFKMAVKSDFSMF